MDTKTCRGFKGKCYNGEPIQPIINFTKRSSSKDGYDYICRACKKAANDSRSEDCIERNKILQRFQRNPKHNPRRNDEGKIFWRHKEKVREQWYKLLDELNIKKTSECNCEDDFRNLIAKQVRKKGYTIYKEFYLNEDSRVDLGMPYNKTVIEVKLNKEASSGSKPGESCDEQVDRYKEALKVLYPNDTWTTYLVSLDGSLGLTLNELLNQI